MILLGFCSRYREAPVPPKPTDQPVTIVGETEANVAVTVEPTVEPTEMVVPTPTVKEIPEAAVPVCPTSNSSIGDTEYHIAFRIYAAPGRTDQVVSSHCDTMAGCDVTILDGPVCINGWNWWYVTARGEEGWWQDWNDQGDLSSCPQYPTYTEGETGRTLGVIPILYLGSNELTPGSIEVSCESPEGCEIIIDRGRVCQNGVNWYTVRLASNPKEYGWLMEGQFYITLAR